MSIKAAIESNIQDWKSKGMTPTTVCIGPDVERQLKSELGDIPTEFLGVKVHSHTNNGFFCSGPWYFSSTKQ